MSIKRFPTIYLWCINLLVLAACGSAKESQTVRSCKIQTPPLISIKEDTAVKFKTLISFQDAQLSGILVAKSQLHVIHGAFVNEFGIKGFEFTVICNTASVKNLMKPLDKWYIRRTLSDDLAFIFSASIDSSHVWSFDNVQRTTKIERIYKGQTTGELTAQGDSLFIMRNLKRNITYQMKRIK